MGTEDRDASVGHVEGSEPPWLEALRRNSGLALDKEGRWTWGGNVAENTRVQALFHRGVEVRDDGEVTLRVGKMWTYVTCPGPAYFLRAIRVQDAGVSGRFLGDRELDLSGAAIGWGPDDRFYVWVAGLPGPAIALREAHQVLADHLVETPSGAVVLALAKGHAGPDRTFMLVPLDAIPGPRAPRPESPGPVPR